MHCNTSISVCIEDVNIPQQCNFGIDLFRLLFNFSQVTLSCFLSGTPQDTEESKRNMPRCKHMEWDSHLCTKSQLNTKPIHYFFLGCFISVLEMYFYSQIIPTSGQIHYQCKIQSKWRYISAEPELSLSHKDNSCNSRAIISLNSSEKQEKRSQATPGNLSLQSHTTTWVSWTKDRWLFLNSSNTWFCPPDSNFIKDYTRKS